MKGHSSLKKMLKLIEKVIDAYIEKVAKTYGHSTEDLKKLLNEEFQQPAVPVPVAVPVLAPVQAAIVAAAQPLCQYVLLRGARAGTVCGTKKKKNSDFCCQHSRKAVVAEPIIVVNNNIEEIKAPKKPNPVLRMNKIIGKWWHPDSCLVFKSSEEKIVIGIFKDNQLVDLSEEDVQTCVAYKFKYVFNKRKREEIEEEEEEIEVQEIIKKPKIDDKFIEVNKAAKNVEILIKEMFNNNPSAAEKEEDEDDDEEEDPIPGWLDYGEGAAESKENYDDTTTAFADADPDEEEDDFGNLSEEEDGGMEDDS
jgi:hypothetical protein